MGGRRPVKAEQANHRLQMVRTEFPLVRGRWPLQAWKARHASKESVRNTLRQEEADPKRPARMRLNDACTDALCQEEESGNTNVSDTCLLVMPLFPGEGTR